MGSTHVYRDPDAEFPDDYELKKARLDAVIENMHGQARLMLTQVDLDTGPHWGFSINAPHWRMDVLHKDFDLLIEKCVKVLEAYDSIPNCLPDEAIHD